ncbi:MAG: hypothetical protein JEZ05_00490 [Tenericutes bacterium]|nr:hypothetical protein [Mycoplasmatota bacterium]
MNYQGGYEFQDKIAVYLSLMEYTENTDSKITCEKKEVNKDYFDDIIINSSELTKKIQVKYSYDSEISVSMLSSGDLCLLDYFYTYQQLSEEKEKFELKIITNRKLESNLFVQTSEYNFGLLKYHLKTEAVIKDNEINRSFVKIRRDLKLEDYEAFKHFLNELEFYQVPKDVSFQFFNEGSFESLILDCLENKVGIGYFPYENYDSRLVALRIEEIFRALRIGKNKKNLLSIGKLFELIGIKKIFDTLSHRFPINESKYIRRDNIAINVINLLEKENRVHLVGEPGAGKSWFIDTFVSKLSYTCMKYCFFISLNDKDYKNRVMYNNFLYNIKYQLLKESISSKESFKLLGAVKEDELISYINNITQKFILVLDGLDHITRISKSNDLLKLSEFIKKIHNDNVKILCVSQPMEIFEGFHFIEFDKLTDDEIGSYLNLCGFSKIPKNIIDISGRNFLYLSYLTKKYDGTILPETLIDFEYDGDIREYYKYLINGESYKNDVLSLIACTNIPFTEEEIRRVLHQRKIEDVTKAITQLKHLFNFDKNSNIYIYHESLKRYFLEQFVDIGVDYKAKYFKDILHILVNDEEYNLFASRKKYIFYLPLLMDLEYFEKVIFCFRSDFVSRSISDGFLLRDINKNFDCFTISAKETDNPSMLLELSEMRKQLNSANEHISEMLDIYYYNLININNNNEYIQNEIEYDFTQYYGDLIVPINKIIYSENISDATDKELKLIDNDYLKSIYLTKSISKLKKINIDTLKSLKFIDINFFDFTNLEISDEIAILLGVRRDYSHIQSNLIKVKELIQKNYISQNDLFELLPNIVNLSTSEMEEFESFKGSELWKDKFYYVFINTYNVNTNLFDEQVLEFLDILKLKKKYIFKGKPRSVDFYFKNSELFFLVKYLIDNIKDKSNYEKALLILQYSNEEYQRSIPNLNILDVFYYINVLEKGKYVDIFIKYINKYLRGNDEYYFDLSKTTLDIIHFTENANESNLFMNFSKEVCSYTMHKDMSLDCLIEGIKTLENSEDKIHKYFTLLDITKYVRKRTDGKETKHFEYLVFNDFYNNFTGEAIKYLIINLRTDINRWQNKEMLDYITNNICFDDELLEIIYYKSLNTNDTSMVFDRYSKLLGNANELFEKDLLYKIHKLNNYETTLDVDVLNEFIHKINKKYVNYKDISDFKCNDKPEKIESEKRNIIRENIPGNLFWEVANNQLIDFKDPITKEYVLLNIEVLLDIYDKKYSRQIVYNNIMAFEEIIDSSNLGVDRKVMFYLKAFAYIRGGWGESFEHFDLFLKAYSLDADMTTSIILDFLAEDITGNIYTLKSSSNKLRIINLIEPNNDLRHYEIIESYEAMLLPYYVPKAFDLIKSLDINYLIFQLMLEKMKMLNRENIINTISVLYHFRNEKKYSESITSALIDFFSNYDSRFPLVYVITFELFNDYLGAKKDLIDITKILDSNDFTLKVYFNRIELCPVPEYDYNNIYLSTWLNMLGLPQFCNFFEINKALEKSRDSLEFQTILNKDLVNWDELYSVENPNLIRMNEQYLFIQELFSTYKDCKYELSCDIFINYTKFRISDLVLQNSSQFIPRINSKEIIEERKYEYHNSKRYVNSSKHRFLSDLYEKDILFYDVLSHSTLVPYHINMKTETDELIISKIILPTENDPINKVERIIVNIQVISTKSNELVKITFKDFLSTIYKIK